MNQVDITYIKKGLHDLTEAIKINNDLRDQELKLREKELELRILELELRKEDLLFKQGNKVPEQINIRKK